jgi:hypothetical protein
MPMEMRGRPEDETNRFLVLNPVSLFYTRFTLPWCWAISGNELRLTSSRNNVHAPDVDLFGRKTIVLLSAWPQIQAQCGASCRRQGVLLYMCCCTLAMYAWRA